MSRRTATIIGGIGRTFITAGMLVMAFALFQLWGTGLQEERAQGELSDAFDARLALVNKLAAEANLDLAQGVRSPASVPGEPVGEPDGQPDVLEPQPQPEPIPVTIAPELAEALIPKAGEAIGRIEMPSIGVSKTLVQGVRRSDLRDAPGHYPESVFPGQAGNAAIAGHRTTYGSPFGDLDLLQPGDAIVVETIQGTFHYEVIPQTDPETGTEIGYKVVSPYEVDVIDDFGDNRLTLTACHPKYSASQRIVVAAELVSEPAESLPELTPQIRPVDEEPDDLAFDTDPSTIDPNEENQGDDDQSAQDFEASLGWQTNELPGALWWSLATAAIGLTGYLAARRWKPIAAYAATSGPFLVMLWVCFEHLDRLLPAF